MPPRASPPRQDVDRELVELAVARIQLQRSCPLTKLVDVRLAPKARRLLVDALVARGFELAGTKVRVSLASQVDAVVGDQPVALDSLPKQVTGGTAAEVRRVVHESARTGHVRIVLRGGTRCIAKESPALLAPSDLDALEAVTLALGRLVKSIRSKKGQPRTTLLRSELDALLTPLGRCARVPQTTSVSEEVLRHLRSTADVTTRMVSVPAALRSLPATISLDVAREALETLAREQRIELRPESGVELLSPEAKALCPVGPRGSVLSYARILAET